VIRIKQKYISTEILIESMANHCYQKFTSSSKDSYRNPFRDQPDYKLYQPQVYINKSENYKPNIGTKKWFQDYRRSTVCEDVLKSNLKTLDSGVRPTNFSDKPDIALGARKLERESLFPVIHNNPVYVLTNNNRDRETYRDTRFMSETLKHRDQYTDKTGSKYRKIDTFYYPFKAHETFSKRNVNKHTITDFPSQHTSAMEFADGVNRSKGFVDYSKLNIQR